MRRVVSCERAFCVLQIYRCACRWAELYAVWPWCFRRDCSDKSLAGFARLLPAVLPAAILFIMACMAFPLNRA